MLHVTTTAQRHRYPMGLDLFVLASISTAVLGTATTYVIILPPLPKNVASRHDFITGCSRTWGDLIYKYIYSRIYNGLYIIKVFRK